MVRESAVGRGRGSRGGRAPPSNVDVAFSLQGFCNHSTLTSTTQSQMSAPCVCCPFLLLRRRRAHEPRSIDRDGGARSLEPFLLPRKADDGPNPRRASAGDHASSSHRLVLPNLDLDDSTDADIDPAEPAEQSDEQKGKRWHEDDEEAENCAICLEHVRDRTVMVSSARLPSLPSHPGRLTLLDVCDSLHVVMTRSASIASASGQVRFSRHA